MRPPFPTAHPATWARIDSLVYWSVGFASPAAGWAVGKGGRITRLTAAR